MSRLNSFTKSSASSVLNTVLPEDGATDNCGGALGGAVGDDWTTSEGEGVGEGETGCGRSRAKRITKATQPSAAMAATPSATHFQMVGAGEGETGGEETGGWIGGG